MVAIFLFSLFFKSSSACEPIKVAVIDSGFGTSEQIDYGRNKLNVKPNFCKYGHADFSNGNESLNSVPLDNLGHGTNIVGVIENNAGKSNLYCIVIIKFWNPGMSGDQSNLASIKAIRYANSIGADIINYSGGGRGASKEEGKEVKSFLDRNGIFVSAAGNDNKNLNGIGYDFYPAMYDKRIMVVGNKTKDGMRSSSSNYGKPINYWEIGEEVEGYGVKMSGTSQATAVLTGKLIKQLLKGKVCR